VLIQFKVGLKALPEHYRAELDRGVQDTGNDAENNNDDGKKSQEMIDEHLGPRKSFGEGYLREMVVRTFPIWGVVLLLIVTRVEEIGLKEYLTKKEPNFSIHFGTYGTFRLSSCLVIQLTDILAYPNLSWKYELLYIPFIMPFVIVSVVAMMVFRNDMSHGPVAITKVVAKRVTKPAFALFGALVLVQLMIRSDTAAPAFVLGNILADWFQEAFIIISPLLGALGAFFSGSTTVSNLTFGRIQIIAAESIGTSVTSMLALQAVGGSAGNAICLHNIIAGCAIVGLDVAEGKVILKTYKFVFASTSISTVRFLRFVNCCCCCCLFYSAGLFLIHSFVIDWLADCDVRVLLSI
jgi:lactate permease